MPGRGQSSQRGPQARPPPQQHWALVTASPLLDGAWHTACNTSEKQGPCRTSAKDVWGVVGGRNTPSRAALIVSRGLPHVSDTALRGPGVKSSKPLSPGPARCPLGVRDRPCGRRAGRLPEVKGQCGSQGTGEGARGAGMPDSEDRAEGQYPGAGGKQRGQDGVQKRLLATPGAWPVTLPGAGAS